MEFEVPSFAVHAVPTQLSEPEHARQSTDGRGREARVVREELNGFEHKRCPAWRAITDRFGGGIRLRELRGIVFAIQFHIEKKTGRVLPPPSRTTKRSLPLLVKYINEHSGDVLPYFPLVTLCDAAHEPIPFLDAGIHDDT
jgi:hypothetical protein